MQPIVIFGGFLSYARAYRGFKAALVSLTRQPVFIVDAQGHDWIWASGQPGWAKLLDKLDRAVGRAVRHSPTGKVTLIGHSAGGVLSRLYLSPEPFFGKAYAGLERVDHLITLGSPHYNRGGLRRGGRMSTWIEARYPGAYFTGKVRYTSVAGKLLRGDSDRSRWSRWVYSTYREICGDGTAWGDGLIPVESALLQGAEPLVLDDVGHFGILGVPWYGSPQIIPRWWNGNSPMPDPKLMG